MDDDGFDRGDARDIRRGGEGPGGASPADLAGLGGMLGLPQRRTDARDKRGPTTMSGRDARDVREQTGRDLARPAGPKLETAIYEGQARMAGPSSTPADAKLTLDQTGLTLEVGGGRPIRAAYRDLSFIAIQQSTVMIVLGEGSDSMPWLLDRFGARIGPLVSDLRERRLKQRLADGLVRVPDAPAELVEFDWQSTSDALGPGSDGPATPATGIGQLVVHPWGFVVSPLDERVSWVHFRRAAIARVTVASPGEVRVDGTPGSLTLRGLGQADTRLHDRLLKLRDGAYADAARFVDELLPDVPFGRRQKAQELLVDGTPTRPEEFGDAGWPLIETAVLGEPAFADSYRSLCDTAGASAPRWVSMSPEDPGGDTSKIWFLIAMPGNLVAMELVTAGAHATYFFRVMPRAQYKGEPPKNLGVFAERAVRDVSEALVDIRFLREPMALPADQLRLPNYLRYRLAVAVLPSLAAARARFVARVVHRDPASWSAAVADLIEWHATARDEAAEWPGRAAQEAQIEAAGGDNEGGGNVVSDESLQGQDAATSAGDQSPDPKMPSGSPG